MVAEWYAQRKAGRGRNRVARFTPAFTLRFWTVTLSFLEANGHRCMLMWRDGAVVALAMIDVQSAKAKGK